MSAFTNLLAKEIKSIVRDPKILIAMFIVPLVMIGVIYGMMAVSMRQQVEQVRKESGVVAVIDSDGGYWAKKFVDYIRDEGVAVKLVNTTSKPIPELMNELGVKILYVIPEGFSANLTRNETTYIVYYVLFKALTFMETGLGERAESLVGDFSDNITKTIIARSGVSLRFAENPINTTTRIIIGGKVVESPLAAFAGVFTLGLLLPLIVFIMLTFIIQFAVTSMAVEKEEKMFETLLTLPVNRLTILGVKLLVSIIIGVLYVGIYGGIMMWFLGGAFQPTTETSGEGVSLSFNPLSVLPPATVYYIGVGLIGAVIFGLLLAIILSMFAEDVRTAQLISNYALTPLVIMFFLPMFLDISGLSYGAKLALSLIPLANIGFIPKLSILGYSELAFIAGVSNVAYAVIALFAAYKIVNTEKIFTAKLLKKRRGRRKV